MIVHFTSNVCVFSEETGVVLQICPDGNSVLLLLLKKDNTKWSLNVLFKAKIKCKQI